MANHRLSIGSCSLEYDAEVAFVKHTTAQGPRVSITSDEFSFSLGEQRLRQALAESVHVPPSEAVAEDAGSVEAPPSKPAAGDSGVVINEEDAEETVDGESRENDGGLQPPRAEEDDSPGTLQPENPEAGTREREGAEGLFGSEGKTVATGGQKTLVVYGPSGQGRSHVVQKLVHASPSLFSLVVQHTSRKRRPNEINGVDFHFVPRKEMTAQIRRGDFIEHTTVSSKRNKRRSSAVADVNADDPHVHQASPTAPAESRHKELLGTSRLALREAQQRGKPCVVLNATTHGAQQLRDAEEDGLFVLLFTGEDPRAHSKEMKVEPDYAISVDNLERGYTELKQFAVQQLGIKPGSHPAAEGSSPTAHEEWVGVPTLEVDRVVETGAAATTSSSSSSSSMPALARVITFSELLAHFQSTAFSPRIEAFARSGQQQQRQQQRPLAQIFSQNKLAKRLHRERNLVLAVAGCRFDNHEPLHLLALQTVHHKLTGSAVACRRFGPHWQDVGFRGVDPADDLRAVGLLGLTQLLCLVDGPRTLEFAREVYRFSLEKSHAFPFSVLSLGLTKIVLTALRDNGGLAKICNKRDQVFAVANEFHAALLYRVYQRWRVGARGKPELGALLREVERHARDNVKRTLLEWESYVESREGAWQPLPGPGQDSAETSATGFTPLEQYSSFADQ